MPANVLRQFWTQARLDCVLASSDDARLLFVQVMRGTTTVLARPVQDDVEGTRVAEYLRIELAGYPDQ
jgi:hypothetical protein